MTWLIIRIILTITGVGIGIFLALRERREHRGSYVGVLIVGLSVIQGTDAAISIRDEIQDFFTNQKDRTVFSVRSLDEQRALEAFNASGQPLWRLAIDGSIREIQLADLDGDGENEIVVGVSGTVHHKDTGRLLVLTQDGSLKWSKQITASYPYASGGSTNQLSVTDFLIGDFLDTKGSEIIVLGSEVNWFTGRAIIVDGTAGNILREYWNPGRLHSVVSMRSSKLARNIILMHGYNNGLRSTKLGDGSDRNFMGVVALDPTTMEGQAPPYHGKAAKGSELWYSLLLPQGTKILKIEIKRVSNGRQHLSVWTTCGFIFYLSPDGNVVSRARADNANCPLNTRMQKIRDISALRNVING